MPWTEVSVMERRREFVVLARQDGANVRELCRHFGISPTTGYKWLGRVGGASAAPIDCFGDRSRRPRVSPARTASWLEAAVLEIRDTHPRWGARKIRRCLERAGLAPPSASTVHAILQRHERVAPRRGGAAATERFERAAPNELWQMDFKGWVGLQRGVRAHPLTVIDDHSRYAVCLWACADEQTATVRGRLERVFLDYGLPDQIYVDNGPVWGGRPQARWTRFEVWLSRLGVELVHSRPYHPQGRGKNERFHRSLNEEVLEGRRFGDLSRMQAAFDAWRSVYNLQRPHEALGQEPPASRYRPSGRRYPARLPEMPYGEGETLRRVGTSKAYISFKGELWRVPQAFKGETVAVRPRLPDGCFDVCFGAHVIARIDLERRSAQ